MWKTNIKMAEVEPGSLPRPVDISVGEKVKICVERRGDYVHVSVQAPPEMPITKTQT